MFAAALLLIAPLSDARGATSPPAATQSEALTLALAGDDAARDALWVLFVQSVGDSEAIALLAVDMIDDLEGDPLVVADAAGLIADVAVQALNALPVVRVEVIEGFRLPAGVRGWDLGPAGSRVFPGFEGVTPGNSLLTLGEFEGISRDGGEGLLSDGIVNVRTFSVPVPDGIYRVVLLTEDLGGQGDSARPLGRMIVINGVETQIVRGATDEWLLSGRLINSEGQALPAAASGGLPSGGATVVWVEVLDGILTIEFFPDSGSPVYVTGIILEPGDGPSSIQLPDVFPQLAEVQLAQEIVAEAIALIIANIVAEAGGVPDQSFLLVLEAPAFQDPETVSEN